MSTTTESSIATPPSTDNNEVAVVQEVNDEPKVGKHVGQCKWWSDKLGYGFVTIQQGEMKGKDIFLHHSGIRPLNSIYRTLRKGEYINFDVIEGANGLQATNVTGIGGGTLICDVNPYIKPVSGAPPPPPPHTPRMAPGVPIVPAPYYHAPPAHTLASTAYITHGAPTRGMGHTGGRGGGQRTMPFSATAPNRPYYRPKPQKPAAQEQVSPAVEQQ